MEKKQEKKLSGLHTFVALLLLFMAAVTKTIDPLYFIAVFFFYLALVQLLSKKGIKLIIFYSLLAVFIWIWAAI
ncbi:hypothetical protein [Aquibacillus saliphilus]|uniref:hypothetical protein n=1 Tax=Aquibacillus saliphilus TaxID=1909422 RepID=UPI001CEFEDA1|nr:hypothetical protein [Aquibacillus saliphilus]